MATERELRRSSDGGEKKTRQGPEMPTVERVFAALSYVSILFLVPMLAAKKTPFIRFHLRQGLVMFVAEVVASVIWWLPVVGWLAGIGVFVLAVMGVLQALAGAQRPLPFVGRYAGRISL